MNAPLVQAAYRYPVAFNGWGSEEHMAIARVVASGQFTMGAEVEAFEHEFKTAHGMKHAIAVNSGSSANLVAVAALQRGGPMLGKFVSVPALAWSTTYAPFSQHGYHLDLLDCDPDTWNVAVPGNVLCSILGNACKSGPFVLLEDNCESIGAEDEQGNLCGTRGLLNTFSFYYSHQLSAIEGGMILTNDDHLARQCRLLRNHGWSRSYETFENEYRFDEMGYNLRPVELHAAIAREQLKKLPHRIAARKVNFDYFSERTRDLPIKLPKILGKPSFFGIHFTVESREKRAELARALRAGGIDCRPPVAGSFRKQPYGKQWADQQTPNADRIHDTGIMIGNPPYEGSHLIDMAVRVMREVL